MISLFLDPYPDEIMYSVIARNAAALNFPNLRSVGITYFGEPHSIATVALPCRLEYLTAHLPPRAVHTVNTLIDEHSLLPFFAPFLPPARIAQLRNDMSGTQGMGIHMRTGIMASTVPMPDTLQLCPACAAGDRERVGEWFWHRQHQVPGVHMCTKHQVWLETSSVHLANRQTRHEYITAENAITYLPAPRLALMTPFEDVLLAISQSAQWLLEQRPSVQGLEYLRERYIRALIKRDLATFTSRTHMQEILEAFLAFYPEGILSFLHCNLNIQSQDNWLARLVRKPGSALHPIHHLLLMHFLGGNIADYLMSQPELHAPFGCGPWPCLNPVCDNYNKCIIKTCTITYPPGLNGRPSGLFVCICGFTYGRAGPDTKKDDIYRRGKIIATGEIWQGALQKHWNDNSLSIREIAKKLGVDCRTVKRYAQRLNLSKSRMKKSQEVPITLQVMHNTECTVEAAQIQLESMRAAWQKACVAYSQFGRKVVRQQVARVYTWLYRHDRDWLEQNLPPRKHPIPPQRIDWAARDMKISQLVPEIARYLQTQPGPPRRVAIAAIARSIGCLAMIQQHLDLLPLTAAVLTNTEESREAFAIRRIYWASTCLRRQGQIKRWELVRLSGVGRLLSDASIQKALDLAINKQLEDI